MNKTINQSLYTHLISFKLATGVTFSYVTIFHAVHIREVDKWNIRNVCVSVLVTVHHFAVLPQPRDHIGMGQVFTFERVGDGILCK